MGISKQLRLQVEGMHCAACARRLRAALEKLPGTRVEAVEVGSATIGYDPEQLDPQAIVQAVDRIGFSASFAS